MDTRQPGLGNLKSITGWGDIVFWSSTSLFDFAWGTFYHWLWMPYVYTLVLCYSTLFGCNPNIAVCGCRYGYPKLSIWLLCIAWQCGCVFSIHTRIHLNVTFILAFTWMWHSYSHSTMYGLHTRIQLCVAVFGIRTCTHVAFMLYSLVCGIHTCVQLCEALILIFSYVWHSCS